MMVENSTEKKRTFYIVVLILTLITMIIGATLAYLRLVGSQKEEGTVLYTGTLQINYIDGTYIKNPELFPLKTVDVNTYDKVYAFSLFDFTPKSYVRNDMIKGGTTVLYVSHSLESIKELCNRVIWIEHGVVQEISSASKICEKYYKKQLGGE